MSGFPTNEQCVENTNNYDISSSSNSRSHILVIAEKVQFVPSHQQKLILLLHIIIAKFSIAFSNIA